MISSQNKGKLYTLDGKKDYLVELFDIAADGWVKIVHPDGRHTNVTSNRLGEIPIETVEDLLEYPEKAVKVLIQVKNDDGSTYVKYLDDDDAVRWNRWMRELCWRAEQLGMNPPWLELKWKITDKKG